MHPARTTDERLRRALRVLVSHNLTNGLSAAIGLALISGGVHYFLDAFAAAAASVGVVVCIPPDAAAPKRGKFWHLLPAALIGLPLFFSVQVLHAAPVRLGLLLVVASFFAFLAAAWGKRGLPISVSVMFSMVFSMAVPASQNDVTAWHSTLYFALGAGLYVTWATLLNALLNARYRVLMLADTLLALARLMRTQAGLFRPLPPDEPLAKSDAVGQLMQQQAALSEQLQTARDLLLESPRTARRQQLAGMLLGILEMRDHLLACELDLDTLKAHPGHAPVLDALQHVLCDLASQIEHLADALLLGRRPDAFVSHAAPLASLHWTDAAPAADAGAPSPAVLARGLANRVGYINEECQRLVALARGEAEPDMTLVRATWQMFVSPADWSWQPVLALWHRDAPPLRHAVRAALAIGSAYALSLALPWGTHDYWILLTIVVVLRGSLAQTLERRNSRVAGTLLGCVLAGAVLAAHASAPALLLILTLAQAIAHGFAIKRYLVTAVAATVLGLVQAHMLGAGHSLTFDMLERIFDTLIGVGIAWAFSYVLPSWERRQIPALVRRTLAAQAQHARVALALGQLQAGDNEPELEWRLARREVHDALSALVQATQRSLSEPRAVRPPLKPLGRLLAHGYQLLAQLTTIKTMLLLRRERLKPQQIQQALAQTAASIDTLLALDQPAGAGSAQPDKAPAAASTLPDPFDSDLGPWVLRRLDLAAGMAGQLRSDADQVLARVATADNPPP